MRLALTPQQAAGASVIAATLLEEQAEGAPGEGAYALDLALEEAGCKQVRAVEIAARDVADVRAAVSAYVERCGGALDQDERAAVELLRSELRLAAHGNVLRLAERRERTPAGIGR
jgi:hypothetical protein